MIKYLRKRVGLHMYRLLAVIDLCSRRGGDRLGVIGAVVGHDYDIIEILRIVELR